MIEKTDLNYTIIIPHHDIPDLLARCLDSIPKRDDLEIVIVDDNSNKEKVDFDNFPGSNRKDTKIILDKKGGGGGYARNQGLKEAKGKWLLFADADDFFAPCLPQMLDKYKDSQADIIFFRALGLDSTNLNPIPRADYFNKWISMANKKPHKAELLLRYYASSPWCKIIRREIITNNNIKFDETPIHNDMTFSYLVGYHANNIKIDQHALYVVTGRKGSVSYLPNDEKRLIRISLYAKEEQFIKQHNVKVGGMIERHYQELFIMLAQGKWKTFRKGVNKIKQYGPSTYSILAKIALKSPHFIKKALRKKLDSVCRNILK